MKFVRSVIRERLVVRDATFVYGPLRDGASVLSGVALFVIGDVTATVRLEQGARMVALGEFSAAVGQNRGVLTLAGAVHSPLAELVGRVAVAVGAVVPLGEGFGVLGADGSVTSSPDSAMRTEIPTTCALRAGHFDEARLDDGLAEFWQQSEAWL